MGEYKAVLTIFDDRNGEIVDELEIELEDYSLPEDGIEEIEEFISLSIEKYEQDVWPQN